MKNHLHCLFLSISISVISCGGRNAERITGTASPSHELWDELLKNNVDSEGLVNYKGFISDSARLNNYLSKLSKNPPDKTKWTREEQLAYWINAYNAFTVKLIVDNYPVKSIRDLHPTLHVPLLNTVWHIKFFSIGGEKFNLDRIEHDILRKEFDEPRIHFAIVCASYSCPPLRSESYTADRIEKQLTEQAVLFINNPKWNRLSENSVGLSSIFKWFKGDFTKKESLIDFLNSYSTLTIQEDAKIKYLDYGWLLNE